MNTVSGARERERNCCLMSTEVSRHITSIRDGWSKDLWSFHENLLSPPPPHPPHTHTHHCILFPLGVATVIILMLLCIICIFQYHLAFRLSTGHGTANVCNELSVCCVSACCVQEGISAPPPPPPPPFFYGLWFVMPCSFWF